MNFESLKKYRLAWEWFCNLALAVMYGLFAYSYILDFINTHRLSSLILIVFELTLVVLLLIRRMPKQVSVSLYDWAIAIMGTTMVVFLRPSPEINDHLVLVTLQLLGMSISLFGLFSLNRSYGTVPANRGIQTDGLYRFVRHPVYAGYFLSLSSYALQNPTSSNFIVVGAILMFKVLRIFAEEELLSKDPDYVAFKQKTRWRIIPYVF